MRTSAVQPAYPEEDESNIRKMTYICAGRKQEVVEERDPEFVKKYRSRHGKDPPPIICTEPCNAEVEFKWSQSISVEVRQQFPLRCKECGGRVMWKKRTQRMVQFEAR